MLTKFSELAKDNSTGGRRSLVAALTDLFMSADTEKAEQVSLMFGDIVMRVLGQLEDEARQALAKRVSSHASAPHDLMVTLAKDQIEIARPVLENSTVLNSDDLTEIASTASMEHLSAIAGRQEIEEDVTSVIVSRGDNQVLTKVAGNSGASFSEETFLRLVDRSMAYPAIQEALIKRRDLPDDAARMLVPFLSDELTERVKELGGDNTLVMVMAERAAEEVAARARRISEAKDQSDQLIKDVQSGKAKLDDAVRLFARSDRATELGILLAKVSHLPVASVSKLVYSKSDKPLVIICKANGVSEDAFKNILTMRARHLGMTGHAVNDAIQRYKSFTDDAASRSLIAIRENAEKSAREKLGKPEKGSAKSKIAFAVHR